MHFYRDYTHQEAIIKRGQSSPKGTYNFKSNTAMASRHPICSLLFLSVHAIPEKLAQRLLVSGLSVGQSPFSLSDIGFLCLFLVGWSMMNVTIPSLLVYIEPVPCLWVCSAVKQFGASRVPRLPREWAAGRRQKLAYFLFRQDALGGVETMTNRPIKCYRTITMTPPNLLC